MYRRRTMGTSSRRPVHLLSEVRNPQDGTNSLGHGGTAQLTVPMEGLRTFSTTSDSSKEKKWIEGIHNDDDDEVIRSGSDSPPPGLCSTPGSDNSFVDDYW